jgi:hydroxyacylglutathione hydrolase
MSVRIAEHIWKFPFISNVYFLELDKKIMIDTGHPNDRALLSKTISEIVRPEDIQVVMFTHLHYDHTGNASLFPNATFYASHEEIESLHKDPDGTVLGAVLPALIEKGNLHPLVSMLGLDVIRTPGHTAGSICLWYAKECILFSGDTLFDNGTGRTDLPTSKPRMMQNSLACLKRYPYKILCPGHDY